MENEQRHQNNHFGTAFFLGLLVGAGIVLLFTTKTGRRLLKAFTEEGVDNISDIKKHFRTAVNEFTAEEEEVEDEPVAEGYTEEKIRVSELPKPHVSRIHIDDEPGHVKPREENGHAKKPSAVRRFFRGTPKKS